MVHPKLVAIDLDGTLLDSRQQASPRNLAALARLLEGGVLVALPSARDCASMALKVPLRMPGLYFLGSGGALIYDAMAGRIVWESTMAPELVSESVAFLRRYDEAVFINAFNHYWVDSESQRVEMIRQRYTMFTSPFRDVTEVTLPVHRVSLGAPVPVLAQATGDAMAEVSDRFNISLASPDWLDLLAPEAGKGQSVAMLQQVAGISPDETVAIGDYDSDLAFFEMATIRVAMGNAVPAVRAAATHVTATNNEDGVALAVERLFQRSLT